MITKQELISYAKTRNLNLGQAELDYIQAIILFLLAKQGKKLIFKGGTALYKAYNLDRFSEDLDFTVMEKLNLDEIINELMKSLERFGIYGKIKEKKLFHSSFKFILAIEGPLYTNTPVSVCKINLDFSLREKIMLEPDLIQINHSLNEIPLFSIFVMKLEEVLAEKIRAIMVRDKARDVYDLSYLLKRKIKFDKDLVNNKLKYYDLHWQKKEFFVKINKTESTWERELKLLVPVVQDFKKVVSEIKQSMK